jgi:hypothetical protein
MMHNVSLIRAAPFGSLLIAERHFVETTHHQHDECRQPQKIVGVARFSIYIMES